MIRFSAALVVVAIGVLIAGVATSSLLLVYVAIGMSAVALLVLAAGVALKRDELFRDDVRPGSAVDSVTAGQPAGGDRQAASSAAGSEASSSRVPVSTAGGAFGTAFSRGDSTRENSPWGGQGPGDDAPARPGRSLPDSGAKQGSPGRPSAWPSSEPVFPAAPAAKETKPPAGRGGTRRPAAPPTRADPVVPWAASLPTRADIAQGMSSDPVPSWLEDVDDEPAAAAAATLAGRVPATTGGARDDADTPATGNDTTDAAEGAPVDPADTAEAADEPAATWRDAPRSWDDASWKVDVPDAGTDSDEEVPAVAATATEAGSGDVDADSADAEAEAAGSSPGEADSAIVGHGATEVADGQAEPGEARVASGVQEVAVVPGVPRYHEPNCILIRFMPADDIQRMTVSEAEEAGCTPCRACQSE